LTKSCPKEWGNYTVYILQSEKLQRYYVGSCKNINERLGQHREQAFTKSFTARANDWKMYFQLDDLSYEQARKIEALIKKMKSKKYYNSPQI
jgi:putative endonuclease